MISSHVYCDENSGGHSQLSRPPLPLLPLDLSAHPIAAFGERSGCPMARNDTFARGTEHKCMGIVEEAMEKREAKRNKPQPWIARKLAVFVTLGIIGYAWYVYVGRLCVPMIRRDDSALGSRGMGGELHGHFTSLLYTHISRSSIVGFLVIFCILGLMMMWAYEKVRHSVQVNTSNPSRASLCAALLYDACSVRTSLDWLQDVGCVIAPQLTAPSPCQPL